MRKLLWPARIGLVTLALAFMPAETGAGRLSGTLCAAQTDGEDCRREIGSYCEVEGHFIIDATPKD